MRQKNRVPAIVLFVIGLLAATSCAQQPKRTIDQSAQTVRSSRELFVSVTQSEIEADINASNAGAAFGLIGALIDTGVNQSRAKDSQQTVSVVRNGMTGYDIDRPAFSAAKQSLSTTPWMNVGKASFSKELNPDQMTRVLDATAGEQVIFYDVRYALNGDFSNLSVYWTISIVPKAVPRGGSSKDRLAPSNFTYNQGFACVSPLSAPAKEAVTNASTWARDNSRPAKAAIQSCLAQLEPITRQSLAMTAAAREAAVKSGSKYSQGTINGKLVQKLPAGDLVIDTLDRWVLVLKPAAG